MIDIDYKHPMTKGKLNRMCKYFKNKKVEMIYEYNNSMGDHAIRKYEGCYDSFDIIEFGMHGYKDYEIKFYLDNKIVMYESFSYWSEFIGLGKLKDYNSGPFCYFSILLK